MGTEDEKKKKSFRFQGPVMFAPSPMATGRHTMADHFPGNQGKGGAGLAKQLLQEAGEWIKGAILLPHILLSFLILFR